MIQGLKNTFSFLLSPLLCPSLSYHYPSSSSRANPNTPLKSPSKYQETPRKSPTKYQETPRKSQQKQTDQEQVFAKFNHKKKLFVNPKIYFTFALIILPKLKTIKKKYQNPIGPISTHRESRELSHPTQTQTHIQRNHPKPPSNKPPNMIKMRTKWVKATSRPRNQ